jgi:MFS family permease
VSAKQSLHTPQFWFQWVVLFCNVTPASASSSRPRPMIQDFFPTTSDAATAAGFGRTAVAVQFMAGRFIWSSTSDVIGRKPTYMLYLGVGAVAFFFLATAGDTSVLLFVALAAIILSFYGGGFATIPAYLKDMFGTYEVGAIHGRLLTAWAAAGVAGPLIVNGIIDSQRGNGVEGAAAYRPALLVMVGLLVIGFVANLLMRPVAAKHHLQDGRRQCLAVPAGARRRAGEHLRRLRHHHHHRWRPAMSTTSNEQHMTGSEGPPGPRLGVRRHPAGLRRRHDREEGPAAVRRLADLDGGVAAGTTSPTTG